jgi:hypothetical protein
MFGLQYTTFSNMLSFSFFAFSSFGEEARISPKSLGPPLSKTVFTTVGGRGQKVIVQVKTKPKTATMLSIPHWRVSHVNIQM